MSYSQHSPSHFLSEHLLERDPITQNFPKSFTHQNLTYKYWKRGDDTSCYYVRSDGIVCRYYEHTDSGQLVQIALHINDKSYLAFKVNGEYYLVISLMLELFLPDMPQSNYLITA